MLAAANLACDRGGRRVFENLNFTAAAGEYLELRGPNGAGKSSLLRLLAGFDEPVIGAITFKSDGHDPAKLHYVGHQDALKPALTVRENLAFWRDFMGTGDTDAALESFSLRPLADDVAGLLSQGQRRRLALSRLALATRPIWLLDEPTVGLDYTSLERLANLMSAHLTSGGIVIAATHADLAVKPAKTLTLGTSK